MLQKELKKKNSKEKIYHLKKWIGMPEPEKQRKIPSESLPLFAVEPVYSFYICYNYAIYCLCK